MPIPDPGRPAGKPKAKSAVRKLELSKLDPKAIQREGLKDDYDIERFALYLSSKVKVNLVDSIVDASISRTIEGASTLTVSVNDYERELLRSGLLSNALDVELDGLWFRLSGVDKSGDTVTLTFQDREIAVLREYTKWKIVRRSKATRAEFILNLIREVKEFKIPVMIPDLHKVQPVQRYEGDPLGRDSLLQKDKGIPENVNEPPDGKMGPVPPGIKVKRTAADREQIKNINTVLSVGQSMGARRKVGVCAIMTITQESTARNLAGGDDAHGGGKDDSAGLFQQYVGFPPGNLSYEARTDPETSARLFYTQAIAKDKANPSMAYWELCQAVQNSGFPTAYDEWRTEAERTVNAFGWVGDDNEKSAASSNGMFDQAKDWITGGDMDDYKKEFVDQQTGEYFFYRGDMMDRGGQTIRLPENSWKCITRLAGEVDWKAFFVSGMFYYISEDRLFKQKPTAIIREFDPGLLSVDANYRQGSKSAEVTLHVQIGRWKLPPGAVVVLHDMGPWNGRWLVTTIDRSLFDSNATITLKKPRPLLPEPLANDAIDIKESWMDRGSPPDREDYDPSDIPEGRRPSPFGEEVERSSNISTPEDHLKRALGNWQSDQAYDLPKPPGTKVFSVTKGTVIKANLAHVGEHGGNRFGAQISLTGKDGVGWFYTHLENIGEKITAGAKIEEGDYIGTVTNWADNPGASHLHIGCDSRTALEQIFVNTAAERAEADKNR